MFRYPWLPLMPAMPQKLLRHWVEEASVAVPFVVFPLNYSALNNYPSCCGGREETSLTPAGEKLRGMDEVVSEWGLTTHSMFANICQTRLRIDCGAVHICLHCCCSIMGDTVRNTPPLAYDIPMNNTVKIGL